MNELKSHAAKNSLYLRRDREKYIKRQWRKEGANGKTTKRDRPKAV